MNSHPLVIATARKLRESALRNTYDPFDRVQYQEKLDTDRFQFPEKYLSLYHHPAYLNLTDEQKWKLSLLEAVNFLSINIYGEQALVSSMESRLYRNKNIGECAPSSKFMQHFIHEENSHTFMLAEYCLRYRGSLFPNRSIAVQHVQLSPNADDLLFYGRTFILESYLAFINRFCGTNDELDQTWRDLNRAHLLDEVRHMAWDKVMVEANLEVLRKAGKEHEIEAVKKLLNGYKQYCFRSAYNPTIYREIGLESAFNLIGEAESAPGRVDVISEWQKGIDAFFNKVGLH